MKNILVAGGGTAGLITALILRKKLDYKIKITMLIPKSIGIIGVGEGSTEHFKNFIDFMGVGLTDFVIKTDATIKSGIRFKNWTQHEYQHTLAGAFTDKMAHFTPVTEYLISQNVHPKYLCDIHAWKSLVGDFYIPNTNKKSPLSGWNQFHFNTFKLNEHLVNLAKQLEIEIIDDEIVDVTVGEKGIEKVKGKIKEYTADFYIDSTGFKRVLIDKLGAKWESYSKYLKLKEAIAFPTEDAEEYNMYTTAQAMNSGWMWNIPVWGRQGNGYIYDTDYINKEQAVEEVEKFLGKKIEVARHIKFDPGALNNVWIKNCVAVGLSANFIEPLEATSIGTSINQAFCLMHYINGYNQDCIDSYNKTVRNIMDNTRDFVALHYVTERNDTPFWKDTKDMKISDSLQKLINIWKSKLIIDTDLNSGPYDLFHTDNFNLIAYAHGLINHKLVKERFSNYNQIPIKLFLHEIYNQQTQYKNQIKLGFLKHKEYIEQLRTVKNHDLIMWELNTNLKELEYPFFSDKRYDEIINYD
jgi:tryptophan halogenase